MSRFIRIPVVLSLVLGRAGLAAAAETKEEKMQSDESQAQYQRKSITYLGVTLDQVNVPADHLAIVEGGIRKQIELKRFDYNAINLGGLPNRRSRGTRESSLDGRQPARQSPSNRLRCPRSLNTCK